MRLPPLEIDDLLIVHYVFRCKGEPQSAYDIETQMRLYGFPLVESLDTLIQKAYFVRTDENGKLDEDGKYYVLSESGKEWAGQTFEI